MDSIHAKTRILSRRFDTAGKKDVIFGDSFESDRRASFSIRVIIDFVRAQYHRLSHFLGERFSTPNPTVSARFHYFYHVPYASQASDPPARSDLWCCVLFSVFGASDQTAHRNASKLTATRPRKRHHPMKLQAKHRIIPAHLLRENDSKFVYHSRNTELN